MKKKVLFLGIVFTVLYACFSWYRIVTTTAPDFSVYYGAAKLLVEGKALSGNTGLYTGFGYPPTTLLLFIPFLLFPYQLAQGLWVTLSFLLVPIVGYLSLKVIKHYTLDSVILWSCVFFWSFPTKWTLGMGQVNLVSLIFLLLGILCLQQKKKTFSVLFFTLLLVSKPHFGIFLPFLFLLGYWQESVTSLVSYVGLSMSIGVLFGFDYFVSYIQKEVPPLLVFSGREIYYNQSLGGFFSRHFFVGIAKLLTQLTSLSLLGGLVFIRRKNIVDFLCLFLPIFLLIEPLGWQHHFVFILPVYLWLWYKRTNRGLLILSYLLISLNFPHPEFYPVIFRSHGFFGAVILCILSIL